MARLVVLCVLCSGMAAGELCSGGGGKLLVSALLDLHSGSTCETTTLHGLQQASLLKATFAIVNSELAINGIHLGLQIFDTCSTEQGTKLAMLKSLVATQQTCFHAPFLLGIIGPERFVESASGISSAFKSLHVVPYLSRGRVKNGVMYVSSYPFSHHTQAVRSVLRELNARKVIVYHEDTELAQLKWDRLRDVLHSEFCFTFLPNLPKIESSPNTTVLLIIENPAVITMFDFKKATGPILISVGRVGLSSWTEPNERVFVLQMVSAVKIDGLVDQYDSDLLHDYKQQHFTECSMSKIPRSRCTELFSQEKKFISSEDWTLLPLQYGVKLLASAVKLAQAACPPRVNATALCSLQPERWAELLSSASFLIKHQKLNQKVTFEMNLPAKFLISSITKTGDMLQVGMIESYKLILSEGFNFPKLASIENFTECESPPPSTVPPATTSESPTLKSLFAFLDFNFDPSSHYETILLILGIGSVITLILTVAFCTVYHGVTTKSSSPRRSSSIRSNMS